MKFKKAIAIITACTSIIYTTGCSIGGSNKKNVPEDEYVVRVVNAAALCFAPIHIAAAKGFFEAEGLKFEFVDIVGSITDLAASGQADAGCNLVGSFMQPLENGLAIKFTGGLHTGCTKLLVKGDSDINSIQDLRRKKIGVSSLADSATITTKRALARAGIGITIDNLEVEFVVYSESDLPLALEKGAIDAFGTDDPVASKAELDYGLKVIIDTTTDEFYKDQYCCNTFVTTDFYNKYPKLAEKYVRAVNKASQWVQDNPYEAAQIQIDNDYVAGTVEFNGKLLDAYNYIPSVQGGYDSLKSTAEGMKEIGLLREDTDIQKLIDKSFLAFEGVDNF